MSPALSKCRVVIVPATTGVLGEPVFPQPQFDSSMLEGIGEVARQVRPARMLSFCALHVCFAVGAPGVSVERWAPARSQCRCCAPTRLVFVSLLHISLLLAFLTLLPCRE